MKIARILKTAAVAALLASGAAALAQDSSYTPGTVWEFSYIKTEPGQAEKYLDWLDKAWKKENDFGVKEGYIVSYHVLSVNDPRAGEPDLILAIEYRDYVPTAQMMAIQKKIEQFMAQDVHQMDAASGERKVLRTVIGGMQLQELKLK